MKDSTMGMYQGYTIEGSADLKVTPENNNYASAMGCNSLPGMVCPPVYECPQERCIHRQIIHEVPHVCPINTRIINHHIYKHTYNNCYTCTEENDICNVNEGCSCKFM